MGKNLIQQARGKGGPGYRARSFRYLGKSRLRVVKEIGGTVVDIANCPGHSAPLALIKFDDGVNGLMIAPEGCRVGGRILAGPNAPPENGNMLPLKAIPEGTQIFNVESTPGDGGKFCRTSGAFAKIVAKSENECLITLPSKKQRTFNPQCNAMIGIAAGSGRKDKPFLKAGKMHMARRARNKRYPMISGAAQNAVDHPFGNKRTARKAKQRPVPRNAPPGRKVGKLRPKRTGRKK